VIGGLAAACLAAVVLRWGGDRGADKTTITVPPRSAQTDVVKPAGAVEVSEPALLAYHIALTRSPEELDALLNKHGTGARETNSDLVPIRAFIGSDPALHSLPGEY
jgi:hypothetical protein